MLFNTDVFIFLFLPGTLVGFFILGHIGVQRASLLWLVVASLFYYGWWNPVFLPLVGGSLIFNYAIAEYIIGALLDGVKKRASVLTFVGVASNLVLLGYFKYANFFLDTLSQVSGSSISIAEIVPPIGISFFTFQQIAYLVDVKKGMAGNYDFIEYSLFVLFFPQLIAGPIVHHRKCCHNLAKPTPINPDLTISALAEPFLPLASLKKLSSRTISLS